ncbi:MAG: hypothetical protein ABR985_11150 [Methanotrichaceae archaeon]|jgi:hypothetical protein
MDDQDLRILGAMNAISPMSFVSPIEVNELVKLNKMDLGDRLMLMKKSGHVDVVTRDFVSSMTLPNFIAKVKRRRRTPQQAVGHARRRRRLIEIDEL